MDKENNTPPKHWKKKAGAFVTKANLALTLCGIGIPYCIYELATAPVPHVFDLDKIQSPVGTTNIIPTEFVDLP